LLELALALMLCTKHISIKGINIKKDQSHQAVVVAVAAAAVID